MSLTAQRRRGLLITLGAVVLLSPDGLVIRLVEADRFVLMFWRGVFMAGGLTIIVLVSTQGKVSARFRSINRTGLLAGLLLGGANAGFVIAVTNTDVANALIIASMAPLFAAVIAYAFIHERLALPTIVAISLCTFGVLAILADSLGGGRFAGDVTALLYSLSLAGALVAMRVSAPEDLAPAMAIGAAVTALVALPFAAPWDIGLGGLLLYAAMFGVLLPAVFLMLAVGTSYLPAAEVGMVMLFEVLLGPLWVWIGVGERPRNQVLAAGVFILIVIAGHSLALEDEARTVPI